MTDQLKRLKKKADDAVAGMGVPTCKTCAHFRRRFALDECGATGYLADLSRRWRDECGPRARYWTPKPPTFWQRLGEAIIQRIRGR